MSERHSRFLENLGFCVGILIGLLYGVAEALARSGICIGKCTTFDGSFPWGLIASMLILVGPKMLGRAQSGGLLATLLGKKAANGD